MNSPWSKVREHSPCPVIQSMLIFRFHRLESRYRASRDRQRNKNRPPHFATYLHDISYFESWPCIPTSSSRVLFARCTRDKQNPILRFGWKKGFGLLRNVVRRRKIVHACHDWSTRTFPTRIYTRVSVKGFILIVCPWHEPFPPVLFHSSSLFAL